MKRHAMLMIKNCMETIPIHLLNNRKTNTEFEQRMERKNVWRKKCVHTHAPHVDRTTIIWMLFESAQSTFRLGCVWLCFLVYYAHRSNTLTSSLNVKWTFIMDKVNKCDISLVYSGRASGRLLCFYFILDRSSRKSSSFFFVVKTILEMSPGVTSIVSHDRGFTWRWIHHERWVGSKLINWKIIKIRDRRYELFFDLTRNGRATAFYSSS